MRREGSRSLRGERGGKASPLKIVGLGHYLSPCLSPKKFSPALLPHPKPGTGARRVVRAAPRGAQGAFVWRAAKEEEGSVPDSGHCGWSLG